MFFGDVASYTHRCLEMPSTGPHIDEVVYPSIRVVVRDVCVCDMRPRVLCFVTLSGPTAILAGTSLKLIGLLRVVWKSPEGLGAASGPVGM